MIHLGRPFCNYVLNSGLSVIFKSFPQIEELQSQKLKDFSGKENKLLRESFLSYQYWVFISSGTIF